MGYSTSAFALETLITTDNIEQHGIYYSKVLKHNGVYSIVGDRILWVVNKTYSYGFGAYTSTEFSVDDKSYISAEDNAEYKNFKYKYDYRGFEFEYLFDSDDLFHFNIQSLSGIGSVTRDADDVSIYNSVTNDNKEAKSNFSFTELGGGVEVNLSQYFRILLNLNYFYNMTPLEFETPALNEKPKKPEISGAVIALAIKIGFYE